MGRADSFEVSGAECVIALARLGFQIVRRQTGATLLRCRQHFVLVPDLLRLPATILDRILAEADISYAALLQCIEELPTEPELTILEP
jgi:hypothetical protein